MVSKIYTTPNFSLKPLELELAVVASKHPSADSSSGPSAIIVGSNADDTSPAVWIGFRWREKWCHPTDWSLARLQFSKKKLPPPQKSLRDPSEVIGWGKLHLEYLTLFLCMRKPENENCRKLLRKSE
ncbi:hypothetical protein EAE99_009538 [Botrytis elliptica]|nr:hypothetical protein EAE99_009538 [Botrytis elliptica]